MHDLSQTFRENECAHTFIKGEEFLSLYVFILRQLPTPLIECHKWFFYIGSIMENFSILIKYI